MSTTRRAICTSARTKIAAMATSRDATKLFIEHKTNQPFDAAALGKVESFEVIDTQKTIQQEFGRTSLKREQFYMVVRLGHGPFGKDYERENYVSQDVDRLADVLENHAWPTGTEAVWFESSSTNKADANWWVTELVFRVVLLSAIEAA